MRQLAATEKQDGGHATRVIVILAGCVQARKLSDIGGGKREARTQGLAKQQRHFTARAKQQEQEQEREREQELKQSCKQHSAART